MKKNLLSIVFMLVMLIFGIGQAWAQETTTYTFVPNQATTGSHATNITNVSFTYQNLGWELNNINPSNQTFTIRNQHSSANFNMRNTTAFPGLITKVEIEFDQTPTTTHIDHFYFNGGTAQQSLPDESTIDQGTIDQETIDGGSNPQPGVTLVDKTVKWETNASNRYNYFIFYMTKHAFKNNNSPKIVSIAVTYATVDTAYVTLPDVSECGSYIWDKNGQTYTASGNYKYTTTHGTLDTVYTLPLTIYPTYTDITVSRTLCQGEAFDWGNTHIDAVKVSDAKTYNYTFETVNGCDSSVTMTLIVNPTYTNIQAGENICYNELPYTWKNGNTTVYEFSAQGDEITTEGGDFEHTATLKTINGCDSVVTFKLHVYPSYNVNDYDTICFNELPYKNWKNADTTVYTFTAEGDNITSTGGDFEKEVTLKTINGCDSVVTFKLHVYPSYYNVNDYDTICFNELPYTWKNGNTTVYEFSAQGDEITTTGGDFEKEVTLQTINGCDSVVTFKLHVYPSYNIEDNDSVCYNELPYSNWKNAGTTVYTFTAEGDDITTAGGDFEKEVTLKTINGCDSVVTFKLHVYPSYYDIQAGDNVLVEDMPYTWVTGQGNLIFVKDSIKDGKIVRDTLLQSINGCDSLVTFTLVVDTTCGGNRMMKDIESNEYHTALLGHKCWMADNLATRTYADSTTATPSDTTGKNVYGLLYSWYTAMKVAEGTQSVTPDAEGYIQGICPKGWHMPTAEDVDELKGYNVRDLHATTLWPVPGLNRTGLSLIPSGLYNYNISSIQYRDINVFLWTAAKTNAAESQMLWTDSHCNMIVVKEDNPLDGMAIRCVRNCIHCDNPNNQ